MAKISIKDLRRQEVYRKTTIESLQKMINCLTFEEDRNVTMGIKAKSGAYFGVCIDMTDLTIDDQKKAYTKVLEELLDSFRESLKEFYSKVISDRGTTVGMALDFVPIKRRSIPNEQKSDQKTDS
jgi:hypothetical protein